MTSMTVVTPSYRADFELCVDLNRSVLEFAPTHVPHHIFVPRSDFDTFQRLSGPRTHIHCREELLPASFVRVPRSDCMINLRWPFVPVRGWIEQQLVKLVATAACTEDVVLLADSDVRFVRPFSAEMFMQNDIVRLYRVPNGVDARLPRHVRWHEGARTLLGLPKRSAPYPDYVHGMIACDPNVVRQMLTRVESTTGVAWTTAIGRQLHFSEWTLYGVFVDEVAGAPTNTFASDEPLCRGHWADPLDKDSAEEFLRRIGPDDVAAMISSKAGTSLDVRRTAFANCRWGQLDLFRHLVNAFVAAQSMGFWCGG